MIMNGSTTGRNRSGQRIYGRDTKWPAFRRGRQRDVFGRDKARLWRFPQLLSVTSGCIFGRLLGATPKHIDVQVKNANPSKGRRSLRAVEGRWQWHEIGHSGRSATHAKDSTMPARDSTVAERGQFRERRGGLTSRKGFSEELEMNSSRIQYRLLLAYKCQIRRDRCDLVFHWDGMFGSSCGCTENNQRRLHGVRTEQIRETKKLVDANLYFCKRIARAARKAGRPRQRNKRKDACSAAAIDQEAGDDDERA